MLLTLSTRSLTALSVVGEGSASAAVRSPASRSGRTASATRGAGPVAIDRERVLEMPAFTMRDLELRGLFLPAAWLAGWTVEQLDELRERADKSGCPCLVLMEEAPLSFGSLRPAESDMAADRLRRLAFAANRLGCNAIGISVGAEDTDDAFDIAAQQVKATMRTFERLEVNVLLMPAPGLTFRPDRLTELIKRIGGFRIGSLPSFGHAVSTGDVEGTLRKLAPYAGAMLATIGTPARGGKRQAKAAEPEAVPDLAACVRTIRSVGFVNTLAIDYVGSGDAIPALVEARDVLQAVIDEE